VVSLCTMITIGSVFSSLGPGRRGVRALLLAGIVLLMASTTHAETYDRIPSPYCKILYDRTEDYSLLENQVVGSNPKGTALAQFVLEAFAQANANNALLDPTSKDAVLTALSRLQAMWVPSALNFKSHYADTGISDDNAVEFIIEPLVQIVYRFPKLLAQYGPANQSGTIEHLISWLLSHGQTGEINHIVAVSYTNVWLTRVCNLILTGQGLVDGNGNVLLAADSSVLDKGRTDLKAWISTTRTVGVHEFLSPAYTGLDLEAIGYIDLFAHDPGIVTIAQQGYKLFWIDLYANWYRRNQRAGGTHSRTYEFLTDEDRKTDRFYYAVSNLTTPRSPAWPVLLNSRIPLYWRGQDFIAYVLPPPNDVPYLFTSQVPINSSRTILRNFAIDQYDSGLTYSENYMGNPSGTSGLSYPFSIGSAESSYDDPIFEGLTIMLPGDGTTTNMNFNMQGRQDYYLQKVVGSKSETLKPFIASVQSGAETLFLATSSGQDDPSATQVASTIIIPDTARIWIGNDASSLSLAKGQRISIDPGSTIFIQVSNSGQTDGLVTGIRFLLSTNMNGETIGLSLVNDGSQYGALRVTCGHAASPPSGGHAVIGFWTRTGYCADSSTRFNAFRLAFTSPSVAHSYNPSSGAISLSVPGWKNTLSIDANAVTETTTSLSGGDIDSAFTLPLLSVNGTEYLSKTVQEWTSQDIGDATGGSAIQRSSGGLYNGRIQVVGSGSDIWGTSDGFQFYYQRLVGNGTIIGRLTNMPDGSGTDDWAKAGLMMRNDLTPASENAFISLDGRHGQRFSVRAQAGHESTRSGNTNTTSPYWFKLTRVNDTFTGYSSHDLVHWTQVGEPTTVPMNKTIYAGVAVTSHNANSLLTTGFDNLGVLQQ
jgi:hypothetical protein